MGGKQGSGQPHTYVGSALPCPPQVPPPLSPPTFPAHHIPLRPAPHPTPPRAPPPPLSGLAEVWRGVNLCLALRVSAKTSALRLCAPRAQARQPWWLSRGQFGMVSSQLSTLLRPCPTASSRCLALICSVLPIIWQVEAARGFRTWTWS
jgi:hypothetical protein